MKLQGKLLYIFILLSTFHMSLQMAQPDLPGNFLSDSHPLVEQKAITMLPISANDRETGFERTFFQPEYSVLFTFTNTGFYHQKLINPFNGLLFVGTHTLTPTNLLSHLCVLRL